MTRRSRREIEHAIDGLDTGSEDPETFAEHLAGGWSYVDTDEETPDHEPDVERDGWQLWTEDPGGATDR